MAKVTITIDEASQLPFSFSITNNEDVLIFPASLRWRVDCLSSGTMALDWQTQVPSPAFDGVIPASANVIVQNLAKSETKRLTVQANTGLDSQWNEHEDYIVFNNRFIT